MPARLSELIFYLHGEFATSLLLVCYKFATGRPHRASTPSFQEGTLSIIAAWGRGSPNHSLLLLGPESTRGKGRGGSGNSTGVWAAER